MSRRVSIRFKNDDPELTGVRDDEVVPPSSLFLDRIRDYLSGHDIACTEVCGRDYYGWEMDAILHGRTFQVIMQICEEWYVDIEQYGLFNWLTGRRPHDECLDLLGAHVLAWAQSDSSGVSDARIAD